MTFIEKLVEVQKTLKAPKAQFNSFAKYHYRSAEDIIEAVKPLLHERGMLMTITDEMVEVGGRVYLKATVVVDDGTAFKAVSGMAREALDKKGMDDSQITGATSSYARKYALNGMFAIDDTKDSDGTNDHKQQPVAAPKKEPIVQARIDFIIKTISEAKDVPTAKQLKDAAKKECEDAGDGAAWTAIYDQYKIKFQQLTTTGEN